MLSVPNHSVGSEGLLLLVERRSHTLQALHASVHRWARRACGRPAGVQPGDGPGLPGRI